ncbi:hypothetical protein [Marinobacter fonticola]|uniref:hypothetical protein n=1 Tax=Marinobacter fonticola TaxID=2603215 RepID=UPI00143CFB10|nr:hypothetical protein [Marinobacter fonticola]
MVGSEAPRIYRSSPAAPLRNNQHASREPLGEPSVEIKHPMNGVGIATEFGHGDPRLD